jgi:hypothetical protein
MLRSVDRGCQLTGTILERYEFFIFFFLLFMLQLPAFFSTIQYFDMRCRPLLK